MVLLAGGNAVDPLLFRYRARDLRAEDLAPMQAAIASHYARGRSFIARTLVRAVGSVCEPPSPPMNANALTQMRHALKGAQHGNVATGTLIRFTTVASIPTGRVCPSSTPAPIARPSSELTRSYSSIRPPHALIRGLEVTTPRKVLIPTPGSLSDLELMIGSKVVGIIVRSARWDTILFERAANRA